jgi:hypothetical protein
MKRTKKDSGLRPEYTPADFPKPFVRGKYAGKIYDDSNVVLLDPEVAKVFPDSESVNEALRSLIRIAKRTGQSK